MSACRVLALISALPQIPLASHQEVLFMVEEKSLHGQGLGLVDAHLLAATLLTPGTRLWTRDEKLRRTAMDMGAGYLSD